MDDTMRTCREFTRVLASKAPTPGGGGAAALVGAVGASLGAMVVNLTLGKPKYAEFEEEMQENLTKLEALRLRLLDLVEGDAKGFAPLAAAYAIPKEDPNRAEILEKATLTACEAPLLLMSLLCQTIETVESVAAHGSRLAVSDAGCAAACCRAALESASLNVFINTKSLRDRTAAETLNGRASRMLGEFVPRAQAVFDAVRGLF